MSIGFDQRVTRAALDVGVRFVRTPGEYSAVLELRRRVFGIEQDMIVGGTADDEDRRGHLALVLVRDGAIGTGRLSPPTVERREGHISWVAVLPTYRGQGAGTALMVALLEEADRAMMSMVTLSAQSHALSFYRRFGFSPYGDRFWVREIEHQAMVRYLP